MQDSTIKPLSATCHRCHCKECGWQKHGWVECFQAGLRYRTAKLVGATPTGLHRCTHTLKIVLQYRTTLASLQKHSNNLTTVLARRLSVSWGQAAGRK